MDANNTYFTRKSYSAMRADWLCIMFALLAAVVWFRQEINWLLFFVMFWYIDVIGTAPGLYLQWKNARAGRRNASVPNWAVAGYNICHSFVTQGIVIAVWYLISGFEWTMLAMPLHLAADRGVFGNIYKNYNEAFEPPANPVFQAFLSQKEAGHFAPAADGGGATLPTA